MKVLRWLTVGLVWAAVVVLALLSSVAFHLRLPMAREVARQATNHFVSGEIGGRLHIGYVEELSPYHVVARDTTLYDQYGAPVAYGDRVFLTFDHRAALEGTLRFSSAHLHTGWVHLIEGDGLPTFIELFDDGLPPSPGPGLHAIVDDLRVQDVTVTGELLGLQGIRVDGMAAHGRLEFTEEIEVRIFSASGDIVEPFPFTARLEHLGGVISTDPHEGIRLHVRTHEGDQRAHANVVYAVPEGQPGDAESELDLLIHAMPVRGETLAQLGFEWADLFHGPATGHVRLYGPVDDLRLRASLETAGGPTQLEGHLPVEGEGFVEARTDGLQLERVMRDAPTIEVAGAFRLLLPADPEDDTRATLHLEPMRYEGYHVPALQVEGSLLEDRFRVDRATGTYRGARLTARGHVDYDGRVNLRVQADVRQVERDPNLSRLLPGAKARMEADVRFATADRSDRIDFRGRIVLHDVSYGALTAKKLTLDGFAKGNPERPEANLKVDAQALAVGGYPLGTAHLQVRGGPRNYEGTGVFEAPGNRRFEVDATVEASPERYLINAPRMELALGELVWRGAAEQVVIVPGQEVTAERFLLAKGHQRLEAQVAWRFDGPDELRAELQSFDLTGLEALLGDLAPAVTGIADAHLVLEGPFENPEILLEGALRGTSYRGVEDMDLVYVFTYREGQLALDAQADLQDRGSVMVTSSGVIDPDALEIADALEDGVYEVSMAIADLKLPVAQRLLDLDLPPAEGVIGGRIAVSGPIQAPSFEGALHVPALVLEDWPALSVHTDFSYVNGAFGARGAIGDEHGDLIEVEGGLLLDLMNLARHPEQALAVLEVAPWRMAVRLAKRRLGALPAPLKAHLPEGVNPLRVSASGTLSGGSLRTRGDLLVSLDWDDPFQERPCGQDAHPRATIQARLENGVTRAQIMGHLGPRAVLSAKAEAPTPIDEWLEEAHVPPMPPVQLAAQVRQLDTGRTPWLCEGLDGPVSGTLEVTGLFTDRPEASASLATNGLVVRRFREEALRGTWAVTYETPPMEGVANAVLRHDGLSGDTTLRWRNGGSADVHAELPLQWDASHPVPALRDDAPIDMEAQLSNMPLSLLLSPVPNLVDVEGTVDGRIATRGLGARPDLRGQVQIQDGYFQVMPTGQQLSAVEGEMTFRGDWIELSRLVAREREGRLEMRGALQLDGFAPSSARIELEAHQFPVRSDGAVLATIGGRAVVEAEIEPGQSVAQVVLREMALALPDDGIRSVQDLEPHADVRIVGYEPPTTETGDPYPIVIAVRSAQPFWVRRNDFAALVTMDLGVTYMEPDILVDGDVTIRRGFFEVFGKRFEVDEARMRFDGAKQMNPMVTLRATHRLRMGGPGDTVSVSVTGRMESPEVQFTTTVPECQDRGDIIALLMSGRCARTSRQTGGDEMQASQQAASFLAGVAAGVLSMSAREQFGDIIPVIVVESGDQAFRSTRVRAGFKADSLIPKPLRPYVLGAYVEGFFSTSGTENMTATTVQGRDNGFLLELQFPANIVGTGAFSPPHSWSLDVTWEP